ncbi:MAG: glycosyltransferase family 9 protein [Gemmatimonadota bacterium]|jgi:heptosyltransferase I
MATRSPAVSPVSGGPTARPDRPLPAADWLPAGGHVCVVLLTGLGDVIHGLPIVNAIRRARPDVRITWVVEPMPAAMLEGHASIDRVVVFHKQRGIAGLLDLRRQLARDAFDLAINFNIYFKSVFPTVFASARTRLGFNRARTRDGVWLFSNRRLPPRPRSHTQDMFLEFLDRLGIAPGPLEWRLTRTPEEEAARRRFMDRFDRPIAAVVPASANPRKDWPAARYIELANRLDRELGLQVVLIGGPGRVETAAARAIVEGAAVTVENELGDGVRRLLWLTAAARLVIAPDTGPIHIARALDVPVVGLYGHTNPWRVGPYRAFEDLWVDRYNEPGEAPDPSRAEPRYGRMERIEVDDVLTKASLALTRNQGPP